jgi:hypothetical protein
MILVQNDLIKNPVWYTLVGKEVHTQLHAATPVYAVSSQMSDSRLLKMMLRPPGHISASFSLDDLLIFYHEQVYTVQSSKYLGVRDSGIRETSNMSKPRSVVS